MNSFQAPNKTKLATDQPQLVYVIMKMFVYWVTDVTDNMNWPLMTSAGEPTIMLMKR